MKALKSRTVWTIVVMAVVNGVASVEALIPGAVLTWLNPVLGLLAIYFKVNPSQNY
jgi:hypothetical protein|tara:strand:- start:606 stop:773 length:168 start_codon:yes stop_codon:yes gene_type:complete